MWAPKLNSFGSFRSLDKRRPAIDKLQMRTLSLRIEVRW